MKKLQICALALGIAAFINTAAAQTSLWLTHDSSWKIEGRELVVNVASLTNPTGEDSGSLFLSVYAQTAAVYDGGAPGQLLARAAIPNIPANTTVFNTEVRSRLRAPRPGFKYTALMLERQDGKKYTIVDWVAFTSLYTFPRKQNGGVGSQDSAIGIGNISVDSANLTLAGRRATFSVARIQSQRAADYTGNLRLAIYSNTQSGAGPDGGQLLASRLLGQLAPGDYFRDLQATLLIKKPRPRGDYYVSLVLEEEQENGFVPVATLSEVGPQKF